MIIAFDFDGTITKRNEYPNCGLLRNGIDKCISKLYNEGHNITIYTCRSTNTLRRLNAYNRMVEYLQLNCIMYNVINGNVNPSKDFNPIKPYWHILVDDSALGFNDDWTGKDIYNLIQERIKVINKEKKIRKEKILLSLFFVPIQTQHIQKW